MYLCMDMPVSLNQWRWRWKCWTLLIHLVRHPLAAWKGWSHRLHLGQHWPLKDLLRWLMKQVLPLRNHGLQLSRLPMLRLNPLSHHWLQWLHLHGLLPLMHLHRLALSHQWLHHVTM